MIDIFPEAMLAVWVQFDCFVATILYSPLLLGMVAISFPEQFLIIHMPVLNMMENLALSSLLMEMRVNAISGACMAFLNMVLDFHDPFGRLICRSPMLVVVSVLQLTVVIFYSIGL